MVLSFITSFSQANSLELGSPAPVIEVLTDQGTTLDLGEALSTGTAPFVIASTTAVSNLNADLLDGQHAPSGTIVGTFQAIDPDGDDLSYRLVSG